MTRLATLIGAAGFAIGIAAVCFASVHNVDTVIFHVLVNASLACCGWFYFMTLRSFSKRAEDLPFFRLNIALLKVFFIFVVVLVNLIVRQDYLRARFLANPLQKVLNLKGRNYEWKRDDFAGENFPEGRHNGVIAQEIEKVLPELVGTRKDGYKGVAYQEIIPVLIEAVKEQQKLIDMQKKEIDDIKGQLLKTNRTK